MSHPPFFFPFSSPLSSLLLSPSPPPLSSTPLPLSLLIFVYSWSHDSSLSPPHQRELNRWIGVETCRGEHFHSTKEQAVERGRERGREGGRERGREGGRDGGRRVGGEEGGEEGVFNHYLFCCLYLWKYIYFTYVLYCKQTFYY